MAFKIEKGSFPGLKLRGANLQFRLDIIESLTKLKKDENFLIPFAGYKGRKGNKLNAIRTLYQCLKADFYENPEHKAIEFKGITEEKGIRVYRLK